MNIKELQSYFKEHLVPSHLYALKGSRKGRICLNRSADGWDIYFDDHRDKIGLMHFATETEACLRMKEEVGKVMEAVYGLRFVAAR